MQTYIDVMHVSRDESTRIFTLAADQDKKAAAKEAEARQADSQDDKAASQSFMTRVTSQVRTRDCAPVSMLVHPCNAQSSN
jgi:hypothetical protein